MYALAAGAAGVGVLALAEPAEAKIVYTPAHIKIGLGGVPSYGLDLDHDGTNDFVIYASRSYSCDPVRCLYSLMVYSPIQGNAIAVRGGKFPRSSAQALYAGGRIGPHRRFANIAGMASETKYSSGKRIVAGHWINVTNRYLGFAFGGKGGTHYGWARLSVHVVKGPWSVKATLTGYAYETIPNKPIIAGATKEADDDNQPAGVSFKTNAPERATLGMLALGAPGLSIWRRKDDLVAAPEGI
jgi:hypothetical protein